MLAVSYGVGFTDQRSVRLSDASAAHCEVLLPLFEGPIGRTSVGRMALGDVDGLVLLREIASGDTERLAPLIAELRPLADASTSKVLGLVHDGPNVYVASQYFHAVSLFELLQLAPLPTPVLVRVIHDALRAAERFEACWHGSAPIRYLFTDAIWIDTDGSVVLSEPGVAACLVSEVPHSLTRGRGHFRNTSHPTDTLAALDLLRQSWTGAGATSDEAARNALRTACSSPGFGSAERGDLARRLAALPPGLMAPCQVVGGAVQTAAGAVLRTRLQHLRQSPFFGDETTDEEETACINVADLRDDFGSAGPPALEMPRASSKHSFDAPEPWLAESEQDEQEVTSAFRPSDLPRLLAGAATQRQAARAPQSHRFRPSPSDSPPEVYDRPTAAPPRILTPAAFDAARSAAPTAALDAPHSLGPPPAAFDAVPPVEPPAAFDAPHVRAASSGSDAAPSLEAGPILDVDLATLLELDRNAFAPPSDPPADSAELRSLRPSQPIPLQRVVDDPDVRAELKRAQWRRLRAVSVSLALAALGVAGLLLSTYG